MLQPEIYPNFVGRGYCSYAVCCGLTCYAAKHRTAARSPPSGMAKNRKTGETCGLRGRQFNRVEKEGKIALMIKAHTKHVMLSTC